MADRLIPRDLRRGRILDIGCGTFPMFLSRTQFDEKWGVDQLVDREARIELDAGPVHLLPFDAHRDDSLPFGDDFFSVVTMLAVFEHISTHRLNSLLRDVHRVLVRGGVFVMTTPAHWTGWLLTVLAHLHFVSPHEIDEHKGSYDHTFIGSQLESAGFARSAMRFGTFEARANLWVTAAK
jgi:SAM-dependent methyltransferase